MLTARTRKIMEEIGWGEQLRQKGRIEGIETGKLEGIETGKLEDARAMIAEGDSLEKIARVTKIPIKTLKTKLSTK
jgi:predicted transposase YdaD